MHEHRLQRHPRNECTSLEGQQVAAIGGGALSGKKVGVVEEEVRC